MSKKNDVILSIDLIVKNEEKNLARCLDSLKPIMEAIPCQLIITDTGSTDKTVEIAKQYTDEVYSFEWCDDFAAARNSGLEKAKGQWFMFIDADEWFEDCKDLIEFFKSGEYNNYPNATYIVRNYVNKKDQNNFEDQPLGRLFKLTGKIKFKGRIHEAIEMFLPIKELKSFVNHYGYAVDNSEKFKENKTKRNFALLLKEYEKEPNNDRIAYLLSIEYASMKDREAYRSHIRKIYDKIKEDYENDYLPYFAYQLALIYKDEGQADQGIEVLKKYKKGQKKNEFWNLDILVALLDLSIRNKQFKEAIKYGEEYFKLFDKLKKGKLDTGISGIVTRPTFINDESAVTVTNLMAQAYLYLEDFSQAVDLVMSLDFKIVIAEDLKDIFKVIFYAAFTEKKWDLIPELYIKVLQLINSEKANLFTEMLENKIVENLSAYNAVVNSFEKKQELQDNFTQDNYVMLQNLRFSMITENDEQARNYAAQFLKNNSHSLITPIYSEFIFFAISMEEYTSEALEKIDLEDLYLYTHKLNTIYSNLSQMFISMFSGFNIFKRIKDIKANFLIICFMEIILVKNVAIEKANKEELQELFDIYIEKAYSYMKYIYNDTVLQEKNISLLPRTYRFIFYGNAANLVKIKGDYIGYVRLLKQAIMEYPIMANVVKVLIEGIETESNKAQERKAVDDVEFEFYARNIKTKIQEIAESGMQKEAMELFNSYKKINPKDEEGIIKLERVLGIDN